MEAFLRDFILIFGLAIGVLIACHRLRVATTVGLLITGVLVGPHGFGLIGADRQVETLAEVGVVLLLFTIGVEFSLEGLLRIRRYVLIGGALQVLMTVAATFFILRSFSLLPAQAVFAGFLISLSSTAIVLKILQQRAEVQSPHGQISLAILIFQDIAVIPMMLFLPFLAGEAGDTLGSVMGLAAKGGILAGLVLIGSKWIVPYLLYVIARTRSRELFLLSVLVMCFGVALIAHQLGLSLALGAFLAGLIISETEFSHAALGSIIPFRDVFTSLFFISIGMLLDVGFLIHHPGMVSLIGFSVMALKALICTAVVLFLGFPLRTGLLAGIALCQVGEFSFILFMKGSELGLVPTDFYQVFLNVSVVTMGVTPFAIPLSHGLANLIQRSPVPQRLKQGFPKLLVKSTEDKRVGLRDHLVIVGYGFNGRNLARAAKASRIPYVVIEMNPQTVKEEKKKGESIFYGDASHEAVLEEADIRVARVVVIVISDPVATRAITAAVRRENPTAFVIVRTRFVSEIKDLYALHANEVIPEEFETSIEIFSRVLNRYLIPRNEIQRIINEVREGTYEMLRSPAGGGASLRDLTVQFPEIQISTLRVEPQAPIVGKSLGQVELRKKYGIMVVAIARDGQVLSNPGADAILKAGDLVVVLARPVTLTAHCGLFLGPEKEEGNECDLSGGDPHVPAS